MSFAFFFNTRMFCPGFIVKNQSSPKTRTYRFEFLWFAAVVEIWK